MIVTWTGPEVVIFYQALKTHKTDWPKIVIELGGTKSLEELQYVHKRHASVLGLIISDKDNDKMTVEGLEVILMQDYEKLNPPPENANFVDSDSESEGSEETVEEVNEELNPPPENANFVDSDSESEGSEETVEEVNEELNSPRENAIYQDVLGEAVEEVISWTGPEFERFCNAYKKHQTNWPKIVEELEGTKSITDLEYVYERHHSNIGLITSGNMTVNGLKSALMEDDRMMFINSVSESEGNHLVAQGDAVEVNRDVVADELVQDGGVDVEGVDVEEVNEMVQDGGVQIQAEDGGVQNQADDVEEVNNEMVQDDVGIQAEDGGGVGAMNAMAHDGGPKPPRRRRLNF